MFVKNALPLSNVTVFYLLFLFILCIDIFHEVLFRQEISKTKRPMAYMASSPILSVDQKSDKCCKPVFFTRFRHFTKFLDKK